MYTRNDSGPDASDNESNNQSIGTAYEPGNAQLDPSLHLTRALSPPAGSYNHQHIRNTRAPREFSVIAISQLLESQAPSSTNTQEVTQFFVSNLKVAL